MSSGLDSRLRGSEEAVVLGRALGSLLDPELAEQAPDFLLGETVFMTSSSYYTRLEG